MVEWFQPLDNYLLQGINAGLKNSLLDWVMPLIDNPYFWWTPIALAVIGVFAFGGRKGKWAAVGALIVVALTDQTAAFILKPLIERIRPCNLVAGLNVWWHQGWIVLPDPVIDIYKASYSFPSNHAANAAGQAFWWGWVFPKSKWWLGGIAGLVGLSRIYIGVHWPTDVLAGWMLGCLLGLSLVLVTKWRGLDQRLLGK